MQAPYKSNANEPGKRKYRPKWVNRRVAAPPKKAPRSDSSGSSPKMFEKGRPTPSFQSSGPIPLVAKKIINIMDQPVPDFFNNTTTTLKKENTTTTYKHKTTTSFYQQTTTVPLSKIVVGTLIDVSSTTDIGKWVEETKKAEVEEDLITFDDTYGVPYFTKPLIPRMASKELDYGPKPTEEAPKAQQSDKNFLSLDDLDKYLAVDTDWKNEDEAMSTKKGDEMEESEEDFHYRRMCQIGLTIAQMKKNGYVISPLFPWDVEAKRRCALCDKSKLYRLLLTLDVDKKVIGVIKEVEQDEVEQDEANYMKPARVVCRYHNGVVVNKVSPHISHS
jgi:hypothetical protein